MSAFSAMLMCLDQVDEIVIKVGIGSGDSRKQTLRLTASSMTGGSNCIMNHDTALFCCGGLAEANFRSVIQQCSQHRSLSSASNVSEL